MHKTTNVGPSWDNSDEYPSINATTLVEDLAKARELVLKIQGHSQWISKYTEKAGKLTPPEIEDVVPILQEVSDQYAEAVVLLGNIQTYLTCTQSVDGDNQAAKAMIGTLRKDMAGLAAAYKPMELLLVLSAPELIKKNLNHRSRQTARDLKISPSYKYQRT